MHLQNLIFIVCEIHYPIKINSIDIFNVSLMDS